METKPPRYPKSAQVGIIVGAVLIFFGLLKLLEMFFGSTWWGSLREVIGTVFSYIWPVALIAAGIFLVWAARTGKFKGASITGGRPLRKSVVDKRIAGVCGGIAEFLGIDSTIVRVLAVILLFVNPVLAIMLYVLAGILLPKT